MRGKTATKSDPIRKNDVGGRQKEIKDSEMDEFPLNSFKYLLHESKYNPIKFGWKKALIAQRDSLTIYSINVLGLIFKPSYNALCIMNVIISSLSLSLCVSPTLFDCALIQLLEAFNFLLHRGHLGFFTDHKKKKFVTSLGRPRQYPSTQFGI